MLHDSIAPPDISFKRSFAASKKPRTFVPFQSTFPLSETVPLLPVAHRVASYVGEELAALRKPLFDLSLPSMQPPSRTANQGLPLGGIGCGSIGRSHTGEFHRVDLHPGRCQMGVIRANQFSIRAKRKKQPAHAVVLSTLDKPDSDCGDLHRWRWGGLDPSECMYHALFPRAWYVYQRPLQEDAGLRLTCRQVSPCMPHEYKDSSLPIAVFRWFIENTGDDEVDVSLMFTYDNDGGVGNSEYYESNSVAGVTLRRHDKIPKTLLRPEWMDSPDRCRWCTFREFTVLILLFVFEFIVGLALIVSGTSPTYLTWNVWLMTSIVLLISSTIALFYPCRLHENIMCSNSSPKYHNPATAYTISADVQEKDVRTTVSTYFATRGDTQGETSSTGFWDKFVASGDATTINRDSNESNEGNQGGGAAVAQSVTLKAGETRELRFCLSWASPVVHFGENRTMFRRYGRLLQEIRSKEVQQKLSPLDQAVVISEHVAKYALHDRRWKVWEERIDMWQSSVLEDQTLPNWYKSQLFNELYFLQAGGSVWCDTVSETLKNGEEGEGEKDWSKNIGHWLYLEGQEYYMYNTADVHFYSSASLAMNWPLVERSIQLDYATSVLQEDPQMRSQVGVHRWGSPAMRKPYGLIPHDLGSPSGAPWEKNNAYLFQDVSRWKDLGTKFVLQVARDYMARSPATNDVEKKFEEERAKEFVRKCWPSVVAVMKKTKEFDRDGDGMIENEGFPDQTYDVWSASGPSAYSGGLWLASLQAAAKLALLMGESNRAKEYLELFKSGQQVYEDTLWNETMQCYDYDASNSRHHDSIMADQLAGEWYSHACNMGGIVTSARAKAALTTVFQKNVMALHNGTIGAMNGMRPDGSIDKCCMQSQEIWTGTTYALAASMIHAGLIKEAFQTASGISRKGWHEFAYFFQTPEAWNEHGHYRSLGYMRPLAVWNMQWALDSKVNQLSW